MNEVTCGQCEHGPDAELGQKKRKCSIHGSIRSAGSCALKCFSPSAKSGLRCYDCSGSISAFQIKNGDTICYSCYFKRLDKQRRFEKHICSVAKVLASGLALVWVIDYWINHG